MEAVVLLEAKEPLYVVVRDSADGQEIDVFEDFSLARDWADTLGVDVQEQYPIDSETLKAMKASRHD